MRAAIRAPSREVAGELCPQLERKRREWLSAQREEDNARSVKLAAHQACGPLRWARRLTGDTAFNCGLEESGKTLHSM